MNGSYYIKGEDYGNGYNCRCLPQTEHLYPPRIPMLNPITQCDSVWRWGLWEVISSQCGTLRNEVSALMKETPEISPAPSVR